MIVHVTFPLPLLKAFDYQIEDELGDFLLPFMRVRASLKGRSIVGYVTGKNKGDGKDLKKIEDIVDFFPLITDSIGRLLEFASFYYLTPLGLLLKYAIPPRLNIEKYLIFTSGESFIPFKRTFKLTEKGEILRRIREGKVEIRDIFTEKRFFYLEGEKKKGDTKKVLFIGDLESRIAYYKNLISETLKDGRNVLFLTPDFPHIGSFFFRHLSESFNERILLFGTHMKEKEKMRNYFRARHERGIVLLGHISSLFFPLPFNSLIIVERHEEKDYKNEKGFAFNSVQLAIKRAEIEGAKIVLGSLPTSLEIYKKVLDNEFLLEKGEIPKPRFYFIRTYGKTDLFLKGLQKVVERAVKEDQKVGIFVYRKDYAGLVFCHICKRILLCPFCEGKLVYKKASSTLFCPRCNKGTALSCPFCSQDLLSLSDFGEEFIEEKIKELFPELPLLKIEVKKDIKGIQSKKVLLGTQILSRFYNIKVEKLIFILSKGLFRAYDFMARERIFQILWNTIDALKPEEVFFLEEGSKKTFIALTMKELYGRELEERRKASFPPFSRLFLIEIERTYKKGEETLKKIVEKLKNLGLQQYLLRPKKEEKRRFKWRLFLKDVPQEKYDELMQIYEIAKIKADPEAI